MSTKQEKSEVRVNSRKQHNLKEKEKPKPLLSSHAGKCIIDNCSVTDSFLKPHFFREHAPACLRRDGSRDEQIQALQLLAGESAKSSLEELAHLAIEEGDLSRVQFPTASVEDMTAMCLHMVRVEPKSNEGWVAQGLPGVLRHWRALFSIC